MLVSGKECGKADCVVSILSCSQRVLLSLMRKALFILPSSVSEADWCEVEELANKQGVLSFLFLGAKSTSELVPMDRIRTWRGDMLAGALRNERVNAVQQEVLCLLNEQEIRSVILKGLSAARYYPQPEVRVLGDVDLLIDPENVPRVDQLLKSAAYKQISNDHAFHMSYIKDGITIEIHRVATEIPESTGGRVAMEYVQRFLDEAQLVEVDGVVFPALSEPHHALMMLLHMERHMLETGIGLRQLCDWAVYMNAANRQIWSQTTVAMLKNCGLWVYAKVITKVCVKYLGLDAGKVQWCLDIDEKLVDGVICDVFQNGNLGVANDTGLSSVFIDRRTLGKGITGKVRGLLEKITSIAYKQFPKTRQYKFLVPLMWFYIPGRYMFRLLRGEKSSSELRNSVLSSYQQEQLYRELKLYEVE